MNRKTTAFALGCALACMAAGPARALIVFGFDPNANNRFGSGYPTAPVVNSSGSFIGAGYDFSGVGWSSGDSNQSVALISPQNFVAASHFEPAVGSTLTFFGGDGQLHNYTVSGYSSIGFNGGTDDLAIGTLTAAIPSAAQIAYYPTLLLPTFGNYINANLLVYGFGSSGPVIGSNTLDGFGPISLNGGTNNDFVYQTTYNALTGGTLGQGGDSGGPTFTVFNGSLAILGVHSAITTTPDASGNLYTFDSFIPSFTSQIDTILASNGGYSLTAVPEPNAVALVLGMCAAGAVAWRRRRG